jgi:hypothetical protein
MLCACFCIYRQDGDIVERREAKQYLVMKGHGNRSECINIMMELVARLKAFQSQYAELAYLVRLFSEEEDVFDEMLDPDQVLPLIQEEYPIVYINVTYDVQTFDPNTLAEMVAEYQMELAYSSW